MMSRMRVFLFYHTVAQYRRVQYNSKIMAIVAPLIDWDLSGIA